MSFFRQTYLFPMLKVALMLALSSALADSKALESHVLVDASVLYDARGWQTHQNVFRPASGNDLAVVTLPAGIWSSLSYGVPLESGIMPEASLSARVRLVGDFSDLKHTAVQLRFRDGPRSFIKDVQYGQRVRPVEGWQQIEVSGEIPLGALELVVQINSHGGGALEIEDLQVKASGMSLTEAAVRGVRLPDLLVPGQKHATEAFEDRAEIAVFESVEFRFDAPYWSEIPRYAVPVRSSDATAGRVPEVFFQLAADKENLLVRFYARDDLLNFDFEPAHRSDAFEFFLMPTGAVNLEQAPLRHEQYTISRKNDQTVYEVRGGQLGEVETRLVPGGWEALLKIPLQSRTRGIHPFNDLALTFNAGYQNAGTRPQEHWLSFSEKDAHANSWNDPSLYVPAVFRVEETVPYRPFWIAGESSYDVTPRYPGSINLISPVMSVADIAFWRDVSEVDVSVQVAEGADDAVVSLGFPADDGVRFNALSLMLSPFNVMAGETIELVYEARASERIRTPRAMFLTQFNWIQYPSEIEDKYFTTDWRTYRHVFALPQIIQSSNRNGRLMINFGTPRGVDIELRNIEVTRRIPEPLDALIRVPGNYSHLWSDEDNRIEFIISSGYESSKKVTLEAVVRTHFGGEVVQRGSWPVILEPGRSVESWELGALPKGYFDVYLKIMDDSGGVLAERELRISKSERLDAGQSNPHAGLWYNAAVSVAPPWDWDSHIALLQGIGIGMVHFNHIYFKDHYGNFIPEASLDVLREFKNAGFFVGSTILQHRPGTREIWRDLDEMKAFAAPVLSILQGQVDVWNFANEPNLPGGWSPVADGREWAMFYRAFYNLVHEEDPEARVVLGSYNRMDIDYKREVHAMNGEAFSDPIIGLHLYRFNPDGDAFEALLERREELEEMYPGWEVWDNESGIVFSDFETVLNLQSKKLPTLLNAGIVKTFFYNDRDLIFPLGDSSPLLPMEAFRNALLSDVLPLGKVTLADGRVFVFLFERGDGLPLAVFWNTREGGVTLELPFVENAVLYDVFGRDWDQPEPGMQAVLLEDRFVRYAEGVDLDRLMAEDTFTPAFQSGMQGEAVMPVTDIYLTVTPIAGQFDRELVVGEPHAIYLRLDNDRKSEAVVDLHSGGVEGLEVLFDVNPVALQPGEFKVVRATATASAEIRDGSLSIGGRDSSGKELVPVRFSVNTAPGISIAGNSRAMVVRNNTDSVQDVKLSLSRNHHRFGDASQRVPKLQPGEQRVLPVVMRPQERRGRAPQRNNHWSAYIIESAWASEEASQRGEVFIFTMERRDDQVIDYGRLPYSALPGQPMGEPFSVSFDVFRDRDDLRIVARVEDTSPVQRESRGDLKLGGDCMIIAIDRDPQQLGPDYGKGDFECGFAIGLEGPTSYIWDGTYGLESARPYGEAIGQIERDENYIYYDVRIPVSQIFAEGSDSAGLSIAFINETEDGERGLIELGRGIFPSRNALALGLLLDLEAL